MDFNKIKGDVKICAITKSEDYLKDWLNVNINENSTDNATYTAYLIVDSNADGYYDKN